MKKGFLIAALFCTLPTMAMAEVKMSRSNICHDSNSPYYAKVKNYRSYATLSACFDAGGRLPKNSQSSVSTATDKTYPSASSIITSRVSRYNRDDYKHWTDDDNNGLNTRHELLAKTSTVKVTNFNGKNGNKYVKHGRWISPYTGQVNTDPRNLHIDHILPLAYAHVRGASHWSSAKKELFANDMRNLEVVEGSLNTAKSAKGPTQWLPPVGKCRYIIKFDRLMKTYNLEYQPLEAKQIAVMLSDCKKA